MSKLFAKSSSVSLADANQVNLGRAVMQVNKYLDKPDDNTDDDNYVVLAHTSLDCS